MINRRAGILSVMIILILIISSCTIFLGPGGAEPQSPIAGNILYVGKTSTYKTIQAAVDNASAGDTIIVSNGTYIESIELNKTVTLIGNSSVDCKVYNYYNGSDENSHFSTTFNITAAFVNVSGFHITAVGNYSYGIFASYSNSKIVDNNINTLGTRCHAILMYYSSYHFIESNTIETNGFRAYGIFVWGGSNNNLLNNTISTMGNSGYGMNYLFSDNNYAMNNEISTYNDNTNGIQVWDSSNNRIYGHTILTTGQDAYGLYIRSNCENNTFKDNIINTTNQSARGIHLEQITGNYFINNIVGTDGQWAHGIYIVGASKSNEFTNNTITNNDNFADGVFIGTNSDNNVFNDDSLITIGQSCYGIEIDNAIGTIINNCDISTTGPTSPGIYTNGAKTTAINTTVTTGGSSNDLVSINDGNLTVINCSFNTVVSTSGVIQVKNFLHLQVYYENGTTPIDGADVKVSDNTNPVYASSGYGGSDSETSASGRLDYIIVTDRWYFYSNTATENTTNVSVKKTIDRTWEEIRPNVDMSSSHEESFIAEDIIAPPVPTGLKIVQNGPNSLNISWDQMPDTVNYTVYSSACQNFILRNVTHPLTWTIQDNLEDDTYYTYRIQAWDKVDLYSPLSAEKMGFVADITPPNIPTGLYAEPIQNDDGLNVSWLPNNDDTIGYEIHWKLSTEQDYTQLANLTHPANWTIWYSSELVNGTVYNLTLRAWDKMFNASNFSYPIAVTHRDYLAPEPPTDLSAKAISETGINLSWMPSTSNDVVKYIIYINESGNGTNDSYKFKLETINDGTYQIITGLSEFSVYHFKIMAVDEANNPSELSNKTTVKTLGTPPNNPVLFALPEYTNELTINITGTCDPITTILVHKNNIEAANGTTNETGYFSIALDLTEGINFIKVRARDQALLESVNFSEELKVILDTELPVADAGSDIFIEEGDLAEFDGTGSKDNYDIANYTWTFKVDDDGESISLYGKLNSYTFNSAGDFEVTLTVTDRAGNVDSDTSIINVSRKVPVIPEQPEIAETIPSNGSTEVSIETSITIKFSQPMNKTSVESSIIINPSNSFQTSWDGTNKTFIINFDSALQYKTIYLVTINQTAVGTNGIRLNDTPFKLLFRTEDPPVTPEPKIEILSPMPNEEFKAGETIIVSGTSANIEIGTEVKILIAGLGANGQIKADGTWEVNVDLPDVPGEYIIDISAGGATVTHPITILQGDEDDGDDTSGEAGLGMQSLIIIIIIVIVIIIVLVIFLKRRGTSYEVEYEDFGEGKGEEGEEVEDKYEDHKYEDGAEGLGYGVGAGVGVGLGSGAAAGADSSGDLGRDSGAGLGTISKEDEKEVFECPDCGEELTADATVCPTCGAEFEEDEDEGSEVEEEGSGSESSEDEDEEFECPDCGATLGADDTVCSNCGAEFED